MPIFNLEIMSFLGVVFEDDKEARKAILTKDSKIQLITFYRRSKEQKNKLALTRNYF